MSQDTPRTAFLYFQSPYRQISSVPDQTPILEHQRQVPQGDLLIWTLGSPLSVSEFEAARNRQPGVALLVILPAAEKVDDATEVLRVVEHCRPQSILPHHLNPSPMDLQALLRRPPDDLAGEVLDYLAWRGIVMDSDTRHIVRRTIELSEDLHTVSALARSLYLSRRALGRRFLDRGLPVPSHWLHFSRVLRASIQLQNLKASLFDVAYDLGYPDGFALSNQMNRLVGVRPSTARERLGWEWILESWLRTEGVMDPPGSRLPAEVESPREVRPSITGPLSS